MSQELDLDELRSTYDHPADKSVIEVLTRLEQAEQAVERVREVAAGWATNDRPFREALIRALDGDQA